MDKNLIFHDSLLEFSIVSLPTSPNLHYLSLFDPFSGLFDPFSGRLTLIPQKAPLVTKKYHPDRYKLLPLKLYLSFIASPYVEPCSV